MNKKLLLVKIFFLLVIINKISLLTKEDIENMMNKQKERDEEKNRFKPPNIVIFTFYKDKINKINYFSRIIPEFLSTIGISANIVNIKDNEVIATIPRGKTFDKKIVLDNFKDVIEKVDIADFTKN